MPGILIVCTANLCRSPMAEALLKRLAAGRPDASDWHIESAGVMADYGLSPTPTAQFVMETMGMDISTHRSQPTVVGMVESFDLILVMEGWQKKKLRKQFPDIAERIYLLSEMAGSPQDIADPVGGDMVDYRLTAHELEHYLTEGFERIYQLASHGKG